MVEKYVDESIDEIFVGRLAGLKTFVKRHERKNLLVDRLTHQFKLTESTKHGKVKLDKGVIKSTVKEFVTMFGKLAQVEADTHNKKYNTDLMAQFAKKFNKPQKETDEWNVKVESL